VNTTKQQIASILEKLPDDCTLEDMQYHLYVADKIHKGIERADVEGVVEHQVAEQKLAKWLQE